MASLVGSVAGTSPFGRFLSIVPPITSVLVQFSPLRTIHGIHKYKTTGEFPALPYISLGLNCSLWGIYAIILMDNTILYGNILGTIQGYIYTAIFHYYATNRIRLFQYYAILLAIYIAVGFILALAEEPEKIIGAAAVGTQYLFFISPFVTLSRVLKTKSVDSLPFDLSFIQFWNSILWTSYGWLVAEDMLLVMSSGAGIFLAFLQLLCHMKYGCFTQSLKELFCSCCLSPSIEDFIDEDKVPDQHSSDTDSTEAEDIKVEELELGKPQESDPIAAEIILT